MQKRLILEMWRNGGMWYSGIGWTMGNACKTIRILRKLEERHIVRKVRRFGCVPSWELCESYKCPKCGEHGARIDVVLIDAFHCVCSKCLVVFTPEAGQRPIIEAIVDTTTARSTVR